MNGHEAAYRLARDRALAAWLNSQPQYVIPGVLDDVPLTASGESAQEANTRTGDIVELAPPRARLNQPRDGASDLGWTSATPQNGA